jgi:hypothetical protein
MEPSGKKGVFVGYSENSKAYKIYLPGQKQIEVICQVGAPVYLPGSK